MSSEYREVDKSKPYANDQLKEMNGILCIEIEASRWRPLSKS